MEIKNLLILCLLLVLLPVWIGTAWAGLLKIGHRLKYLCFSWVSGFFTMMAAAQILLVPMVLRRIRFSVFQKSYTVVLCVFCAVSAWYAVRHGIVKKRQGRAFKKKTESFGRDRMIPAMTTALFAVGAAGLIFVQAYFSGHYQHIDDDDSRFVVEEVIAVERGVMYTLNPVNGKLSYWDMGEVKKDMTSPWTMFIAYISAASNIPPAVLSHKYLPFFLIPMCYAVSVLIGMMFFKNNVEKTSMFLIFVSALHMYGYSSTHMVSAVMLLRIWQGKAVVGSLMLPMMFYVLCEILERRENQVWYAVAAVTAAAAALCSGIGITSIPVAIGVGGVANLLCRGGLKKTFKIWCTAIPSVVFLLCYLFFWQLLKIYF